MFKRLLLSLSIILVVGAAGIGATRALLTSNAVTLAQNSFDSGTLNLQIALDNTDWSNTSQPGFSGIIRPGETKSFYFWLKNNTQDVSLDLVGQVPVPTVTGGVADTDVFLVFTPVDGAGVQIPGSKSTTSHSLKTYFNPQSFPNEDILAANGQQRFRMDVRMNQSINSQGSVNFDVVFTGTQVAPTPTPTP